MVITQPLSWDLKSVLTYKAGSSGCQGLRGEGNEELLFNGIKLQLGG